MMPRNLIVFVIIVVIGALLGLFIGKVIAKVFPENSNIRDLFSTEISPGLQPTTLDLGIIILTFGCIFKLNITAVIGILLAMYIFRIFTTQ